jgi:uncharacterized protein (DUF885 family)
MLFTLTSGCEKATKEDADTDTPEIEIFKNSEEEFDLLTDELFADCVSYDSLTMNYSLSNPGNHGIKKARPATLGETINKETIAQTKEENRKLSERLSRYRYDELRPDQQIVYDILIRNLELSEILDSNEDTIYYMGIFFPTAGLHVQLPILLAEFRFYTAEDIDIYFELLIDTQRYFDEFIEFERERAKRGYFLSETNAGEVIGQCESFLENTEENLLIELFDIKIDAFDGINNTQREQYKEKNRELVFTNILPAYESLLAAMLEMKGVGESPGGLASLPEGKTYARAYLRHVTGSDKTPE